MPLNSFGLSSGLNSSNIHSTQVSFTAYTKRFTQLVEVIHLFQCLFRLSTSPSFNYLHRHSMNVFTGCSNLLISTESQLHLRFYLQAHPVKLHTITENPLFILNPVFILKTSAQVKQTLHSVMCCQRYIQ